MCFIHCHYTAGIGLVCGSCTHGSVNLVYDSIYTSNQGRVEVCVEHTWVGVCYDGFDSNDARVVCRQLGYDVDSPGTSESLGV